MNQVIYVIILLIVTMVTLHSQTIVSVQKEISKNLMQCEFEFLNGSQLTKKVGERWNIEKKGNQLNFVGRNPNLSTTEVTLLDGSSYYSTDNQTWNQKSYVVSNPIEENRSSLLAARLDVQSNSIEIDYTSNTEGTSNFYLMPITGANRIFLGSSFISHGINQIQFNLNEVKSGNYFLIVDQNNVSSLCKIIIF